MTQKEIADILNISRSTVSLALANSPKIKEETSRRVRELARRANYQPDMAARSLVTGRTNLIGILLPSFAHRFIGELSNDISHCLCEKGYSAIFSVGGGDSQASRLLDSMAARKVDGIIASMTVCDVSVCEKLLRLNEKGIPVVFYRKPESYPLSYVDVDRYEGCRALTRHLIETGRRRIAFVGGIDNSDRRFQGYQAALSENDISVDEKLIVKIVGEMRNGIDGMRRLLEKTGTKLPDAVIFHNDAMAIGGMNEAIRAGIRVPGDMAVAGFDDIEEAQYCVPTLTTARQPRRQIAEELVNMIMRQIGKERHPDALPEQKILQPVIVVRESSGNVNTEREVT